MKETKPHICIIEKDDNITKPLEQYLSKANIIPTFFSNTDQTDSLFETEQSSELIILGLDSNFDKAISFLNKLTEQFKNRKPTVLILAHNNNENEIIQLLKAGADDFIISPFSTELLYTLMQANLRRQFKAIANAEESIQFDDFALLLNSCVLKKGNVKIPLSTKEYEVLEYLLKHAGEILSPDQIYKAVWSVQFGDITAVAVYIQRLRKKIEDDLSNCKFIKTAFGKGYIFNKETILS